MVPRTTLRALLVAAVPTVFLASAQIEPEAVTAQESFGVSAGLMQVIPLSDGGIDFFGVGGGHASNGMEQQFSLSAHSGRKGDFGQWSLKVTSPDGLLVVRYTVDVTCVNAHFHPFGTAAVIHGFVDKVEPVPNGVGVEEGDGVLLGVKDGGESGSGFPVDDFFTPHNDALLPDEGCKFLFWEGNLNNVDQGNVLVKIN